MPRQEESVIDATQTAHGYLVSPLSEHINETPEGFLVVVGCPVARTGWQTYAVRDLPQESAKAMGIDIRNPNAEIELYRPAREVFGPEFLASLNGKPVTDGHPPGFVDPTNFSRYSMGHLQNPRKGPQMEDGEWPIIADLVISAEPLIGKVKRKEARDVSLGYDYGIEREGERINQVGMIANHNAIVPKGRAGDLIAIGDAASEGAYSDAVVAAHEEVDHGAAAHLAALGAQKIPTEVIPPAHVVTKSTPIYTPSTEARAAPPEPAASPPVPSARPAAVNTNAVQPAKREKHIVKNPLLHIWGLGLRALGADAATSPEDLAQAALDIGKHAKDADEPDEETRAEREEREAEAEDKKARDRKKAKDRRAKDAFGKPDEDDEDDDEAPAYDAARRKAHDDLDAMIDGRKGKSKATDADIAALRDLLDDYLGEEEEEPEHQAEQQTLDADPAELEELLGAGEEPDAADGVEDVPCPDCGAMDCEGCGPLAAAARDAEEGADPGEELEPSGEEALVADRSIAADGVYSVVGSGRRAAPARRAAPSAAERSQAADAARAVLKMLRPGVARAKDERLTNAFNAALASVTRSSRPSNGGYGAFASAASSRSKDLPRAPFGTARAADSVANREAKMQKYYDDRRKGGK